MKIFLAVLPLFLLMGGTYAAENEEKIEIKQKNEDGKSEMKMKIKRKGDGYVGISDGREYQLRGESVSRIESEGEYYVSGRPVDDVWFETTEVRPVTVHRHEVTTEERPVIQERRVYEERPSIREREVVREREADPPVFKAGPLEIHD